LATLFHTYNQPFLQFSAQNSKKKFLGTNGLRSLAYSLKNPSGWAS
jgi:hypothetical protein